MAQGDGGIPPLLKVSNGIGWGMNPPLYFYLTLLFSIIMEWVRSHAISCIYSENSPSARVTPMLAIIFAYKLNGHFTYLTQSFRITVSMSLFSFI